MDVDFDKQYYNQIWGTVHRHDYCETLADQLIAKYNPKTLLDIGTGCGFLVKTLRDRGVEAYGLDISPYAVENSHGNVLLGDIRNLPFKDKQFDVIHSQGLWEYLPEYDIQQAYNECLRVGNHQTHNIDPLGSGIGEEDFITAKPLDWWSEKLQAPKILVGCPVHESKESTLNKWYECIKAQTYPNLEICMAYSGDDRDFPKCWANKIPMIDTGTQSGIDEGREQCIEAIRQKFIAGDYYRYFNYESDILIPPETIETLLKYGRDADWISHSFTDYNAQVQVQQGIGCSLFTKKILKDFKWQGWTMAYDGALWEWVRNQGLRFTTIEIWNLLDVKQIGEGHRP